MEVFLVGGAVRDELLGKKPKDKDYVVTDSTPQEMRSLGFQEIGQSFPVYLHPMTREEYALIRGVSLKEDLERRDLTINAMAMNQEGEIIDPFFGKQDLDNKILRHVSIHFAEDPLRIFRVARFQASLPEFSIALETKAFMRKIISSLEFTQLSGERIFREMKLALEARGPTLFFETLKELGALHFYFLEIDSLSHEEWKQSMSFLGSMLLKNSAPMIRYSALLHLIDPLRIRALGKRLKAPNDWTEAAVIVAKYHKKIPQVASMEARSIVKMFYEMDAFRRPYLIEILSETCEDKVAVKYLEECFHKTFKIKIDPSLTHLTGKAIGEEIKEERIRALASGVD